MDDFEEEVYSDEKVELNETLDDIKIYVRSIEENLTVIKSIIGME